MKKSFTTLNSELRTLNLAKRHLAERSDAANSAERQDSELRTQNSEPRGAKRSGAAGFTLIEILVALFIFALVVPTIYAAYHTTLRITSEAEYGDLAYSMGRSAMDRVIKDLESVCAYQGVYKFKMTQAVVNDQTVPMLNFFSSAHLAFSGRGGDGTEIALISYHVEKGEDGDYTLMRTDSLVRGNQADAAAEPFVVCEKVKTLALRFYDGKGQEYEFWDSDSDSEAQKKKAPAAVLIDLQLVNPEGKESPYRFLTRIKIGAS